MWSPPGSDAEAAPLLRSVHGQGNNNNNNSSSNPNASAGSGASRGGAASLQQQHQHQHQSTATGATPVTSASIAAAAGGGAAAAGGGGAHAIDSDGGGLYSLTGLAGNKDRFDRSYSRHINYDLPESSKSASSTASRRGLSFPHLHIRPFGDKDKSTASFGKDKDRATSAAIVDRDGSLISPTPRYANVVHRIQPAASSHGSAYPTSSINSSINANAAAASGLPVQPTVALSDMHHSRKLSSSPPVTRSINPNLGQEFASQWTIGTPPVGEPAFLFGNAFSTNHQQQPQSQPSAFSSNFLPSRPASPVSTGSGMVASSSHVVLANSVAGSTLAQAAVSAAVAAAARKEKNYNRFVALPDIKKPEEMAQAPTVPVQPVLEDEVAVIKTQATSSHPSTILGARARISVYCTAGAYHTKKLRTYLSEKYRDTPHDGVLPLWYHEAMYARYLDARGRPNDCLGDIIYFDYGVVIMWGLSRTQEADVLTELSNFEATPLDAFEVQVDQFELRYSPEEQPRIHNDIITINNLEDHHCKLAISHALSQSTKLCVFEERIEQTIESSKHIPGDLALTGQVQLSRLAISKKIGFIFMQKSAVNLLTDVLDTPEYFWSAPDHLQGVYKAVRQYMEISARVEVLNTRLMVLQDMLEMLKDQQDQFHSTRLEYIVIILISVEVLIGIVSVAVDLFKVV